MARRLARLDAAGNTNRTGKQQQLFGERGFPRIGVRDDRETATSFDFVLQRQFDSLITPGARAPQLSWTGRGQRDSDGARIILHFARAAQRRVEHRAIHRFLNGSTTTGG